MCNCGRKVRSKYSKKDKSLQCEINRTELVGLNKKLLKIISPNNVEQYEVLLDFNKRLTKWTKDITTSCPDINDYDVVKKYIENEYTEHTSQK